MADVNSSVLTDFNTYNTLPSFYRDILAESLDPAAALRKIIEKVSTAVNDKNTIVTNGIVVGKLTTANPQTFINKLKKASEPSTIFTEYRVVLVEDGISLNDITTKDPNPHDRFKYLLSRYYTKSENMSKEPRIGSRVRIAFVDTKRTEGWITELI